MLLKSIGIAVLLISIVLASFGESIYVNTTDICFGMDKTSGKEPNAEENPIQPQGFDYTFGGWEFDYYCESSIAATITFNHLETNENGEIVSYDDTLRADSSEGIPLKVPYTLQASIDDIYLFYANFGSTQYKYNQHLAGEASIALYESMRKTSAYIDVTIGELIEDTEGLEVQRNTEKYLKAIKPKVEKFAAQIGVRVDSILPGSMVDFEGSEAIQDARDEIADIPTQLSTANNEKAAQTETNNKAQSQARIDADKIKEEAKKTAVNIKTNTQLLLDRIAPNVIALGKEDAFQVFMAKENAKLIASGALQNIYLDGSSDIGQTFYSSK